MRFLKQLASYLSFPINTLRALRFSRAEKWGVGKFLKSWTMLEFARYDQVIFLASGEK